MSRSEPADIDRAWAMGWNAAVDEDEDDKTPVNPFVAGTNDADLWAKGLQDGCDEAQRLHEADRAAGAEQATQEP